MKKYLSAALSAVLIAIIICAPSSALRGRWSDITWTISDGVLTVSGGNLPDSTASYAAPWLKFADRVTGIVLGSGVKTVGDRAFEDMRCAVSVDLGNAETIGKLAFSGCSSVTELSLPESVLSVGDFAFAQCSSLKKINLPASVKTIGAGVFEACPSLERIDSVSTVYYSDDGVLMDKNSAAVLRYPSAKKSKSYTVPNGIKTVAAGAFRDCIYLETVSLSGVESIGDGAFYGCVSLYDLNVPDVRSLGRASFYGCASLEEVSFSAVLTAIGNNAFGACSYLGIADFAGDAPVAERGIFEGCGSNFTVLIGKDSGGFGEDTWLGYPVIRHGNFGGELDGVTWTLDSETGVFTLSGNGAVPDFASVSDTPWYKYRRIIKELKVTGVSAIGANSFRYSSIRKIELPQETKSIGDWAFSGCTYLNSISAKGVESIGACAFFGDYSLLWADISAVNSIGNQCFSGCDVLLWVITGKSAPAIGDYVFDGTEAAVLYPRGGVGYTGGEWDSVYSEAYTAGDADGDGKCNIYDVSLTLKYLAKWNVSLQRVSADVNGDGRVNLTDVSTMLKYIAGWNVRIGIESIIG